MVTKFGIHRFRSLSSSFTDKNCRLFAKFKIPYLDLDFKTTLGVLEGENTFPLQDSWTTPKHSAHTWLLIFARTELFFCINPH